MSDELLPPAAPSNGAAALVTQGFASAQGYAGAAFNEAIGFLGELSQTAAKLQTIAPVDGTLPPVATLVDGFTMPALPVAPADLSMNLPPVPAQPTLTPVVGFESSAAPEFTAQMPPIDLTFAAPGPLTAVVPTAPTLNAVVVPDAPDVVLPDVPTLLGVNVPLAPLLALPTFTAVTPDSPLAPDYIFSFSERAYTSSLLNDLRSTLDTWVNGAATGLSPAVEAAIWNRGRDREVTASGRKLAESMRSFARLGFTKPPGALALEIAQGLQESQSTLVDQSRDVMIKQADMEQANRKYAFDLAWKVEEGLITYNSQIAQRSFETAKYAQQIGIDIYHETVARYGADIQAFAARVEAYKATLTGELAKLDVYKAELEGQKLIGELNMQAVEVYKARIGAAQAVIEIFKASVDAANTEASINKTQIEAYAATVGAYAETVRAKASEYDMYATRVKAEVSKVDVFSAQASAYNSQVQGFKATVDALVAQKNIEIKVGQEVPLDLFKSLTEAYRTQVGAETERVGALVKTYEAGTSVFTAEVQGETARVNSEVAVIKADTDIATATGNLRIEAAKANINALMQQVNYLVESIKGGAQVAAQLAASALSAVNLSGQIGDHTSYGVGYNVSNAFGINNSTVNSTSTSDSRSSSTSELTSTSTNANTNTSTQVSTSDSTAHNYSYSN
jgi:hypothetical protein